LAKPTLSIRAQLARTGRRWVTLAGGGWVCFVATVLMPTLPMALMVASFVLTCSALIALIVGLRCPHCRRGLTQVGLVAAFVPNHSAPQLQCPRCGTQLD
jgi:hypothetical protein